MNLKTIRLWLGSPEDDLQKQIDLLNAKIAILSDMNQIKEPDTLGHLTITEAYQLFVPLCNSVFLSDENYNLCSITAAKIFTNETKVQYKQWVKDDHDCDNFSFASMGYWSEGLKSFAYGIAWSQAHAFNILIDEKKQIWIVEPQTNNYMTLDEAKTKPMYWPMRLILM